MRGHRPGRSSSPRFTAPRKLATITVRVTARLSDATTPLTATAALSRTRRARSTASRGRARFATHDAPYSAAFGSDLEPIFASDDLMVVCVNTTRAQRHKDGEVSALQIDRVAQTLALAKPAQLRIVLVHQPVAVTRAEDEPNLLRGHAPALQRWSAAGADLVMGGHIHLPYVQALHGLARPVWAVQAGTAVSSRVRQGMPNSVNLLRWDTGAPPGCCAVEQWDFSAADQAFARAALAEVRPSRE